MAALQRNLLRLREHAGWLPWLILGFGIAVRLARYATNFSFESAESELTLNLLQRSPLRLLEPLAYDQGAPWGFLLIEKLAITLLGSGEFALRLFPLLCGIVSLPLLYALAKRVLSPGAVWISLALFSVSRWAVFYSANAKQYSSDLLIALALPLAALKLRDGAVTLSRVLLLALAGALIVWFSHSAVFVLIGTGLYLAGTTLFARDRRGFLLVAAAEAFWVVSFAVFYLVSLRDLTHNEFLLKYWRSAFMPLPPVRLYDLRWFPDTFVAVFKNPGGMIYPGLAGFTFLLGLVSLAERLPRRTLLLLLPIVPALFASGLKRYPFGGRLILFLVPVMVLGIAEGIDRVRRSALPRPALTAGILCAFLLYDPLVTENRDLFHPDRWEETRPAVRYLADHWRGGDLVYVYAESQYSFAYYSERFGFHADRVVVGGSDESYWDVDAADLEKLVGNPRVWLLFSDVDGGMARSSEENFFVFHLDRIGRKLDTYRTAGAVVHLYDLAQGGGSR